MALSSVLLTIAILGIGATVFAGIRITILVGRRGGVHTPFFLWVEAEDRLMYFADPGTAAEVSDEQLDRMIVWPVDEQFLNRGFTLAKSQSADFLVSCLAVSRLDLTNTFDDRAPTGNLPYNHPRPFYESTNDLRPLSRGTQSVEIINPKDNQLIRRGQAGDTIKKTKDLVKTVKITAEEVLSKFPPKNWVCAS